MNLDRNYSVPFPFQMDVTTAGTPEKLEVKREASTIAFNDNDPDEDTITDSGSELVIAGFQSGDNITVSGSGSNDGTYTISSVVAGTITLHKRESLTNEVAGASVKLSAPKVVPESVKVVIKAKHGNSSTVHLANESARAANATSGNFSLSNNQSVELRVNSTDQIWVDAAVSGEGLEIIFEKNI